MQLTDTHCHIQSVGSFDGEEHTQALWRNAGDADPDAVIARAQEAGVTRLVCVGCTLEDSELAVNFVKSRENCWASIGIHPHEAKRYAFDSGAREHFAGLATADKVIAVGECGLDYYYEYSDKQSQANMLRFQIELALEHNLPLIFHVRDAFDDFWPIFESYQSAPKLIRGVLHSFTDSQANLDRALGHGLYIGVNGIATFTRIPTQQELYRTIPLTALLLETDAPFLTPTPDRGKICEPKHVRTTAEFLASQRDIPISELAEATTANARQLFEI